MIKLHNITKTYKFENEIISVLNSLNLNIHKGDFLAIMGPSGAGKSTLLNIIGFIDCNYSGEYLLDGEIVLSNGDSCLSTLRNKRVGFVFQSFNLVETMTIRENIELPLLYNGWNTKRSQQLVQELICKLGIQGKEHKYPKQLSGGQQQRAAIARAIINNPDFILADEPTGALDTVTSEEIMKIFKEINKEGTTVILVTHDEKIAKYCSRVVRMQDGELFEQ